MSKNLGANLKWEAGMLAFFYRQLWEKRPPSLITSGNHLALKTAIVTGSNVGLGLEASRQLLALGLSTLVLAVRSLEKGEAAASSLRSDFPGADIRVWHLDMDSYDSVIAFAKRCDEELDRLDIAILNAGVLMNDFQRSKGTGHELVLQVNYLSTALLAILLLPVLRKKRNKLLETARDGQPLAPARLSITGSDTHYWSVLNDPAYRERMLAKVGEGVSILDQFDQPEGYNSNLGYQRSKVLLVAFVARLAEQYVDPDEVLVNCVNPGLSTESSILRDGIKPTGIWLIDRFAQFVMDSVSRTLVDGASTYIDASVWKGKETHGSFVSDWVVKPYPAIAYSRDGQAFLSRVWEETLEELKFAGAASILDGMKN
ncbi:hypothetical protein V8F20_001278 [Naviculisporaceae sp. PSN 640]